MAGPDDLTQVNCKDHAPLGDPRLTQHQARQPDSRPGQGETNLFMMTPYCNTFIPWRDARTQNDEGSDKTDNARRQRKRGRQTSQQRLHHPVMTTHPKLRRIIEKSKQNKQVIEYIIKLKNAMPQRTSGGI